MPETIMIRAGLQDNCFRNKNAINTQKYTRQLKKLKKFCNINFKETNLKPFLCHKTLGCKTTTLFVKEKLSKFCLAKLSSLRFLQINEIVFLVKPFTLETIPQLT